MPGRYAGRSLVHSARPVTYIVQANKAPAGAGELAEAALKQISLAGGATAGPSRPAASTTSFPPPGRSTR